MDSLGIAGIFLFGSQAQGIATKDSDFDFGVLLNKPQVLSDYKKKNIIYDALYDIFSGQIKKLCDMDIVFLQAADLQLKFHVVKDGVILYLGNEKIISDFMENTILFYADFAPIRKEFQDAILERI